MNDYVAFSDPALFPTERLKKERLTLLRCVNDDPNTNYLGNPRISLKIGKYYTGIGFHSFLTRTPTDVTLTDEDGRIGGMRPYDRFEIINDPCGLVAMPYEKSLYLWRKARLARVDKSHNIVDDDYLRENRLALLLYYKENRDALIHGQQYFAISGSPDGYEVLLDTYYGKRIFYCSPSDFDILSDPLGLFDASETERKENENAMKTLHPDLFEKMGPLIRWASGRTSNGNTVYDAVCKKLESKPQGLSKEAFLDLLNQVLQEELI